MGAAENLNHPFQYLFDEKGKKSHVVVPINLLEEFVEDYQDSMAIKDRKNESTISLEELKEELKKDGKL